MAGQLPPIGICLPALTGHVLGVEVTSYNRWVSRAILKEADNFTYCERRNGVIILSNFPESGALCLFEIDADGN